MKMIVRDPITIWESVGIHINTIPDYDDWPYDGDKVVVFRNEEDDDEKE